MSSTISVPLAPPKTYACGTLVYTKFGLIALFAWFLWGDFCFTLMEAVVPSVLPLKLKGLGAPNWIIGMVMATLPGILNMTICPYVSFKSDRYRSKWGRRIPFILWTLPFLCVSLALLGLSDDIASLLQRLSPTLQAYSPATVTIGLIAVFMVTFQFFNMFVGSVFWYLANDVVPPQFIGRFMGLFRIFGTAAGAMYNFFVFKYAGTHMREILIGASVVYFIGVGAMCLMVKEGEYPPLEGEADKDNKGWGGIRTFLKESFVHKFYWMRFLSTAFAETAMAIGAFSIFFYQDMGLNLGDVGKMSAVSAVAVMSAMYFMAVFIDRWHPLRICVYAAVFGVIGYAMNMVWIFTSLPANYFFWLNIGNVLIAACLAALSSVAGVACQMRIFPQSRYGQFCAAQALVRSAFTIAAGMAAGAFIDICKWLCGGSDYAYRFIYLWMLVFMALSGLFLVSVYIQWNRMGGDKAFHPPAPWSPSGVEELPVVPTVGPQSKWLKIVVWLYDAIMGISLASVPLLMLWMHIHKQTFAFKWYGLAVLPLFIFVWLAWRFVRGRLMQDINAAREGRLPQEGIPHHGALVFIGCKFLLALGIWVAQVLSSLHLGMESGAVAFGVVNAVVNLMLIGALHLIRRIERGFSTSIDVKRNAA